LRGSPQSRRGDHAHERLTRQAMALVDRINDHNCVVGVVRVID
jgi:hypothetical protein